MMLNQVHGRHGQPRTFGGIVRCDLIAEGILQAIEKVGLSLPIVVRLEGTNAARQ
jgi:succinyl-CoA synthetase beta subunit